MPKDVETMCETVSKQDYYDVIELLVFLHSTPNGYRPVFVIEETTERGNHEFAVIVRNQRSNEDFWLETFKTMKEAQAWAKKYLHRTRDQLSYTKNGTQWFMPMKGKSK